MSNIGKAPAKRKLDRRFAFLNKNLCNFPIARDQRSTAHFRQLPRGRWVARIAGNKNARLVISDSTEKRLPSGFDMRVLLVLLFQMQTTKNADIEFKSMTAIAELLQIGAENLNRQRRKIKSSLAYLTGMGLKFRKFYLPGNKRVRANLPPPIASMTYKGSRVRITIDQVWCDLTNGKYKAKIPLCIPSDAHVHNAALMMLVRDKYIKSEDVWVHLRDAAVDINTMSRKIGITSQGKDRKVAFERIMQVAWTWFTLTIRAPMVHRTENNRVRIHHAKPRLRAEGGQRERVRVTKKPIALKVAMPEEATDEMGNRCTVWKLETGEIVGELPPGYAVSLGDVTIPA